MDFDRALAESLTIKQAAAKVGVWPDAIRDAIRSGELPASVIGGRDPRRAGRGLGYRIKIDDLQRWYFGELPKKEPDDG